MQQRNAHFASICDIKRGAEGTILQRKLKNTHTHRHVIRVLL
jgi:signal transduction histidine kinase